MSFESLLTQTCDIQRYSLRQNDTLGQKKVWSTVFDDVKTRVEQLSSEERLILGREGMVATHRAYVMPTTTTTVKDRLISGGITYDITGADESRGANSVHHYELTLNLRR